MKFKELSTSVDESTASRSAMFASKSRRKIKVVVEMIFTGKCKKSMPVFIINLQRQW